MCRVWVADHLPRNWEISQEDLYCVIFMKMKKAGKNTTEGWSISGWFLCLGGLFVCPLAAVRFRYKAHLLVLFAAYLWWTCCLFIPPGIKFHLGERWGWIWWYYWCKEAPSTWIDSCYILFHHPSPAPPPPPPKTIRHIQDHKNP